MTKLPTLNFLEAIQLGWKNKFKCASRARRSEFWWNTLLLGVVFTLCSIAAFIVFVIVSAFTGLIDTNDYSDVHLWIILEALALIIVVVLHYPLVVRRLHDVGKSGRWAVIQMLLGWTLPLWFLVCYGLWVFVLEESRFPFVGKGIHNFWDCLRAILFYGSPLGAIIGIVLTIYLCVLCVRDSQKEENQYGPSPKYVEE
jgi:uncharacterized membrane protein YhaH (DUF805 family)